MIHPVPGILQARILEGVCSQCLSHRGLPSLTGHVASLSTLLGAGLCGRCTGVAVPLRVVPSGEQESLFSPIAVDTVTKEVCGLHRGLRSPTLQADSLPAEPQGKPKNTGVGSLSLLLQISPTQESNQGLLHGNPLQCSCLENPRDRGAWWAAV